MARKKVTPETTKKTQMLAPHPPIPDIDRKARGHLLRFVTELKNFYSDLKPHSIEFFAATLDQLGIPYDEANVIQHHEKVAEQMRQYDWPILPAKVPGAGKRQADVDRAMALFKVGMDGGYVVKLDGDGYWDPDSIPENLTKPGEILYRFITGTQRTNPDVRKAQHEKLIEYINAE